MFHREGRDRAGADLLLFRGRTAAANVDEATVEARGQPTGGKLRLPDLLDGALAVTASISRRPDEVGASGARHRKAPASIAATAMSRASFAVTESKPVTN